MISLYFVALSHQQTSQGGHQSGHLDVVPYNTSSCNTYTQLWHGMCHNRSEQHLQSCQILWANVKFQLLEMYCST